MQFKDKEKKNIMYSLCNKQKIEQKIIISTNYLNNDTF